MKSILFGLFLLLAITSFGQPRWIIQKNTSTYLKYKDSVFVTGTLAFLNNYRANNIDVADTSNFTTTNIAPAANASAIYYQSQDEIPDPTNIPFTNIQEMTTAKINRIQNKMPANTNRRIVVWDTNIGKLAVFDKTTITYY